MSSEDSDLYSSIGDFDQQLHEIKSKIELRTEYDSIPEIPEESDLENTKLLTIFSEEECRILLALLDEKTDVILGDEIQELTDSEKETINKLKNKLDSH